MALDLTNDYKVVDGQTTFTVNGLLKNGYVIPGEITEQDSTGGGYIVKTATFHTNFPPVALGSVAPGSAIVWDGDTYVAQSVGQRDLGGAMRLEAIKLDIGVLGDLPDLVTLWPVVVDLDDDGSRISSHPAADATFADIRAKVQPQEGTIDVAAGKHQFRRKFDIYVAIEITTLAIGDLIIDQDANQYDVVSWRNRARIDELSVIEAEFRD